MTPEEVALVNLLGEAWNAFLLLEKLHPDDVHDFRRAIHDAQRLVIARPGQRFLRPAPEATEVQK